MISGDTAKSENLEVAANGADLLIHEALSERMLSALVESFKAARIGRTAKLAGQVTTYHTTTIQTAEIAEAAGVPVLGLTHLIPPPDDKRGKRDFLRGMRKVYGGKIVLGEDGTHFALPAKSDEIRIDRWLD